MRVPVLVSSVENTYTLLYIGTNTCRVVYNTTESRMTWDLLYGRPEEGETILLPAELAL